MKEFKTSKKKLSKKLGQYSALVASAIAVDASAQVTYTDIKDTTLINNGDFFDIDFNSDGINDLVIKINKSSGTYTSTSVKYYYNSASIRADGDINVDSSSYAYAFNLNDTVKANTNNWNNSTNGIVASFYSSATSGGSRYSSSYGNFAGLGDKYLGVRFKIGTTTHYGWVRLDVAPQSEQVTIKDFAYEATAAASIAAGDTGIAIPVGLSEDILLKNDLYFSQGELQLKGTISPNSTLRIYDLSGKLMQEELLQPSDNSIALKSSYQGVYVVELRSGRDVFRKKLWLEK